MEQINQTPAQQNSDSSGNVSIWIGVVIVIAAVITYFLLGQKGEAPMEPTIGQTNQGDTTVAAQEQLDSIDTGNLDADLKNIDDQLNSL